MRATPPPRRRQAGGEGTPPPPGVCVVCVCVPRVLHALRLCASRPRGPAAAPAPATLPGVVGQHGPGRGAAEDRQKAGEDGSQEEDGEAGVWDTASDPGRHCAQEPESPGGASWRGAGEARAGLGTEGSVAGAGLSALLGTAGHNRGGVRVARGTGGGDRVGPKDKACTRPYGRVGFRGPGVACARKAREEIGTWKRTFRVPRRATCAKPGEWRRGRGGGNKILVARKVSKKLELMRGAEPRLPGTREWIRDREAKGRGFRDHTVSGARSGSVCNFPFPWLRGGACAGGPNRCGAAAALGARGVREKGRAGGLGFAHQPRV